jgi:signal transduction histidine kinase
MPWKTAAGWFRWRGGIRHRLLWTGLLFLGIALLANTIAGGLYTRRQIKRAAVRLQTEVASKVANHIAGIMDRKTERLMDLTVSLSLYGPGTEGQRTLALLLLKNDPAFTGMTILDAQGNEIVKVSERRVYFPSDLANRSTELFFRQPMQGAAYVSPVYTTDKAEPYVTMAVPILQGPGRAVGVVAAEVNLTFLWQIIGDVRFSETGNTFLVDGQGNLIAHRDPSLVLRRTNLREHFKVREFVERPASPDAKAGEEGIGIMGHRVISTYAPVRGLRWAVVVTEPVDSALADLGAMQRYAILLLVAGLGVGSLLILWVSNKITAPIRELHRGVEIMRQGGLEHRVDIKTGDEIEQLAAEFNEMAAELENSYGTLEQRVEQRTKDLSALYEVTTVVNESLELAPVLDRVIQKISTQFHFDATAIFLFDAGGEQVSMRASSGASPEFWGRGTGFRRGEGVVGRVAQSGEPLVFEDIANDPRYDRLTRTGARRHAGIRFLAILPIKTKGETVGIVISMCKNPRQLSEDELKLLTSMSDQIGAAIQKASLFEESVSRAKELSALYEVTATVNQSRDPDVVLREVVHKVLQLTGFDAARVYLFDSETEGLRLKFHEGLTPEFAAEVISYRAGEGIDGKVAASGEPAFFYDIQNDPLYDSMTRKGRAREAGFRTLMSFPLRSKTRALGTINFLSRTPRSLLPRDRVLLLSMANQICVALENAKLFEQTVAGAKEISALYDVTKTVNQSLDLTVVLQEVIEKFNDIFRFHSTRIYLADPHTGNLNLQASYSMDGKGNERVRSFGRGEGIIGKVADSGEPMIFEDLRTDPRYQQLSSSRNTRDTGNAFLAIFPIMAKFKTVGTILCNGRAARRLTPGETQLITSMAAQIGVAVENARLYSETKQKTLELEKANTEMEEAYRAKGDFLAAMSHELRTPLNVIIGNADLCRDGFFGDLSAKQRLAIDKILRYSRILLKLISDVLTLTKIEAKKMSLDVSTFEIGEVIEQLESYVEQLNHNGRVTISWSVAAKLPPLTTDALKLEEILQNLIGNAYKFTPSGSIEIRVRDLAQERRVEFAVADTGIGIKPDDLDKIFDEFHQLEEAHTGSYFGVGLGLSIIKKYLDLMKGDIRVKSTPGAGSTFTFTLPYSLDAALPSRRAAAGQA